LARRKQREEKPPPSNRGRRGARGVFLIFDRTRDDEQPKSLEPRADADEPLARDDDGDDDAAA